MKKMLLITAIFLSVYVGNAFGQGYGFGQSWDNTRTYIRPYKSNAYGPGIHSDSTGKPFQWRTRNGYKAPFGRVKPNGYGLGIGMDIFGRPVKPSLWGTN